jgi:BlaI family transcriptional regulator, penicillinase repressor
VASKPDLSSAEFEVMNILWNKGRATVREIQSTLGDERKLSYSAISTLLGRMREKGYVEAKAKDFAYEFRPLVKRQQVVRRKLDDLVHKILGGDVSPLAAYIAENRSLTPEQIKVLEEIAGSAEEER